MSNLTRHTQQLDLGAEVTLMKLDLNPIGVAAEWFFCNDYGVVFGGQAYDQVVFEITEIERNATGEMVAPKLSLPNTTKFASSLVTEHRDAIGAEVTRTKTYAKFLDGQPTADPTAILHEDVFVLEQKVALNRIFAQWELRVLADTGDRKVPGRLAMKELCPYGYRQWNGTAFVYPKRNPCPYSSMSVYRTIDNQVTANPALDACDHKVDGGCKAREAGWPNGILGFGGFPGMSRFRVR